MVSRSFAIAYRGRYEGQCEFETADTLNADLTLYSYCLCHLAADNLLRRHRCVQAKPFITVCSMHRSSKTVKQHASIIRKRRTKRCCLSDASVVPARRRIILRQSEHRISTNSHGFPHAITVPSYSANSTGAAVSFQAPLFHGCRKPGAACSRRNELGVDLRVCTQNGTDC